MRTESALLAFLVTVRSLPNCVIWGKDAIRILLGGRQNLLHGRLIKLTD
jgi:hypothetical protein